MFHLRCLPLSRGVPTSFYNLMMIFLTNRGTPQYNSPFNQIKALAHNIYIYISFIILITNYPGYCPRTRIGQYLLTYIFNPCAPCSIISCAISWITSCTTSIIIPCIVQSSPCQISPSYPAQHPT